MVCGVWVDFLCFASFCSLRDRFVSVLCICAHRLLFLVGGVCCIVLGNFFGYSGRTVDALACLADEGRVRLR